MRSKVTVVLLFLNVVLFGYIYWFETVKPLNVHDKRVLGPEAATIGALTRTTRAGETVKLEKRTDSWWLTAPYEWPADPNAISGLLSSLELLEHETSFPVAELAASGRSLADYGLADPALTLGFTSAGRNYTLKIGDTTEVGNHLYVLSADGTRIHVVSRSFAEAIGLPLDTLRTASLFTVPVFEVRGLNVQTANLKVRLRRDAAARWAFEAPINARASKAAVEVTINAVNALTARTFLEPRDTDLDRAGLNAPALRVTLEGNARRETLLLGNATGAVLPPREGLPGNPAEPGVAGTNPGPAAAANGADATEYYAKIEDKPVVFTTVVPKPLLEVLRATQEALRDPHVLDFEPATVTGFTIIAPGQPELALQKLEGDQGWQAIVRVPGSAPQAIAADPAVVTELLQKISLLSAREARPGAPKFLSDAPTASDLENWGFNRPEREIILNLNTGGLPGNPAARGVSGTNTGPAAAGTGADFSTLTLQVGVSPDKPGEAFARVTNAPFVYQILPDILDEAPALARHFRRRVLRELPEAARITDLKLTVLPAGTEFFDARNETALTAESLASAKIPEKARAVLATLLGQLRTLRAKAFTAGTFTPEHAETPRGPQPWKYRLDTTFVLPGGNGAAPVPTVSTLYFTDRLGGTTMLVGTPDFDGVVFEATQEMLDTIFTLTYVEKHDPGPPAPAPEPAAPAATSKPEAQPPVAAKP